MKIKLIAVVVLLFVCSGFSFAQEAFFVIDNSNSNKVSLNLKDIPSLLQGAQFDSVPFYQVFWDTGDGNYYQDTSMRLKGGRFYDNVYTHVYKHSGTYTPKVLLIERKSNNEPPSKIIKITPLNDETITIDSPSDRNAVDFIDNINPIIGILHSTENKRVGIENSHKVFIDGESSYYIEEDALTAFVLAFTPKSTGKLFFFYPKSLKSITQDLEGDFDFSINHEQSRKPSYGKDTLAGNITVSANLGNRSISSLSNEKYDSVLIYSIKGTDLLLDSIGDNPNKKIPEELRLFYYMQAHDIYAKSGFSFMVLLASENSSIGNEENSIEKKNYINDSSFLENFVDASTGEIKGTDNLYFVDADIIQLKPHEPKDPNDLKVIDICKCCSNCEDYVVTFELEFCNIGEASNKGANILIEDNTGRFKCFTAISNQGDIIENNFSSICQEPNFYIDYTHNFNITNYNLEGNTCRTLRFTAQVNKSELLDAFSQIDALVAYVEFHETPCDTLGSPTNFILRDTLLKRRPSTTQSELINIYQGREHHCIGDSSISCFFCCEGSGCWWRKWLEQLKRVWPPFPFPSPIVSAMALIGLFIFRKRIMRGVRNTLNRFR